MTTINKNRPAASHPHHAAASHPAKNHPAKNHPANAHPHHAAAARDTFSTVTINVKSNPVMPQNKVEHDVRRASKLGSIIGWQEMAPDRYRQAIRDLGPNWGHYMPHDGGLQIPNPISWKKSEWKLEDSGYIKTHNGKAKVSPNRYITWVKLQNKATGKEVVRINTHLVSGAWSEHKPTTGWRRDMWNEHIAKLKKLVDHFEKKGLEVIVGGDFNRDSYKVLGNEVAYDNKLNVGTHGHSTYDYLMHTKGKDLKNVGVRVDHGFASDHDAVVGTYKLK